MCSGSYHCTVDVPLHSSDVTISLHCILFGFGLFYRTLKVFYEWNMRYALIARWLYLARRKKKNKIRLIQGMRFLSALFNLVNNWGVVQQIANAIDSCNGTRFRIWRKVNILFKSSSPRWIEHQSFTLCEISYHRTICHSLFVYFNFNFSFITFSFTECFPPIACLIHLRIFKKY